LFEGNKDHVDAVFTDRLAIFKKCIANGNIDLRPELRLYEFGPADGTLFHDLSFNRP
jgi:hypothetical protein